METLRLRYSPVYSLPHYCQVDICLFDKTGTLTSDKLRAESLITPELAEDISSPPVIVKLSGNKKRGGKGIVSRTTSGGIVEAGLAAKVR